MIHHKTKTIFIHIPKTAGSSIETLFTGGRLVNKRVRGGSTCRKVHDLPAEYKKEWPDYFTFTIVRNPWSRLLSDFSHQTRKRVRSVEGDTYRHKAKQLYKEMGEDAFLFLMHNHFQNYFKSSSTEQSSFLIPMVQWFDSSLAYSKVFRIETLSKDLALCDELRCRGVGVENIPMVNVFNHRHYTEVYDAKAVEIVADAYKEDIERFNYKFGD